jgi:hypothetical protein
MGGGSLSYNADGAGISRGDQAAKPNKKTLVKRAIGAGLTLPSQAWWRIRRQPHRG